MNKRQSMKAVRTDNKHFYNRSYRMLYNYYDYCDNNGKNKSGAKLRIHTLARLFWESETRWLKKHGYKRI